MYVLYVFYVNCMRFMDAVIEYHTGTKARCIAKVESYAARTRRRKAEIAGLKEALNILEGENIIKNA